MLALVMQIVRFICPQGDLSLKKSTKNGKHEVLNETVLQVSDSTARNSCLLSQVSSCAILTQNFNFNQKWNLCNLRTICIICQVETAYTDIQNIVIEKLPLSGAGTKRRCSKGKTHGKFLCSKPSSTVGRTIGNKQQCEQGLN